MQTDKEVTCKDAEISEILEFPRSQHGLGRANMQWQTVTGAWTGDAKGSVTK
jgi:hypothetical protein